MTGFDYVVEALELFEQSLSSGTPDAKLRTVKALADRIGYSVHHFARLFSAVTGVSPKEYMRGRILSEAAKSIVGSGRSLSSIAFEAGFSDYETFSRAFKSCFGMPPKRLKELHYIPFSCKERLVPMRDPAALSLAHPRPELIDESARHLTGMAFYMEEGTASFHKPWAVFMGEASRVRGRVKPETFYQFSSWSSKGDFSGISILCALETEPDAGQESLFYERTIPPAACLRFVHTAGVEEIPETYRYIYQHYFAETDLRPADCWEFQRYTDEGKTTEILIPVILREGGN